MSMIVERLLAGGHDWTGKVELNAEHTHIVVALDAETWTIPLSSVDIKVAEKNPYPDGSFEWAEFEYSRGKHVTCDDDADKFVYDPAVKPWPERHFPYSCIYSRKWRLA